MGSSRRTVSMKLSSSLLPLLLPLLVLAVVQAEHHYFGHFPRFSPVRGFDWEKFSTGVWFVTRKFANDSSCLTYEFRTDSDGFKCVEQVRQVSSSEAEHAYKYTGQLSQSADSSPAEMMVRFPLNKFGASDFVILDTEYLTYGLVCTCQGLQLFFTYGHRRSCSILQRSSTEDPAITERMRDLLYAQIEDTRDDFKKITQEGCDYDKESVNIDLEGDSEVC